MCGECRKAFIRLLVLDGRNAELAGGFPSNPILPGPRRTDQFFFEKDSFLFGTDSDQNGMLEEIPRSGTDSYRWLSHLGVLAPYAGRRKRRYEANQVWLNTTFISQGPQLWGKLAVETWRVKTELIIITVLHIIIITASILNLGFKTIAPKILAHKKLH